MTTLTTLLQTHKLSDGGVPVPPKPALLPPGCGLSSKPSHFGRQRPASVNSVQVQFYDGSSFAIPPDTSVEDKYIATRYTAAIHSIQADPRKFSTSSASVVCQDTGHSFDKCDVFNDIAFLKKHHIAYCSSQRRLKKMMTTRAAVNRLATVLDDKNIPNQDVATAPPYFC